MQKIFLSSPDSLQWANFSAFISYSSVFLLSVFRLFCLPLSEFYRKLSRFQNCLSFELAPRKVWNV